MQIHDVAKSLLQDYDNRCPGASFAHLNLKLNIEQAYELQFAIASMRKQRGERIIGYKVGFTGPATQERFKIKTPATAVLFEHMFVKNGSSINKDFGHRTLIEPDLMRLYILCLLRLKKGGIPTIIS